MISSSKVLKQIQHSLVSISLELEWDLAPDAEVVAADVLSLELKLKLERELAVRSPGCWFGLLSWQSACWSLLV